MDPSVFQFSCITGIAPVVQWSCLRRWLLLFSGSTFKMLLCKEDGRCQMGLIARKPVFGVSVKARFKPVSSATETIQKIEISPVATLHMKGADQTARLRRLVCACVVGTPAPTPKDKFSRNEARIMVLYFYDLSCCSVVHLKEDGSCRSFNPPISGGGLLVSSGHTF